MKRRTCPKVQILLVAWLLSFVSGLPLLAATYSWSGGGTPDGNWTNSANWSSSVPVSASDADLVFGTATGATAVNGIANPFLLRNLTFNSGAGAFTLSGSPLTIYGTVANNAASLQTIGNNVTLAAHSIWNAASGNIKITGNLTGPTYNLTKSGSAQLRLQGSAANIADLNIAAGTLLLNGGAFTNTWAGDADIFTGAGSELMVTNGAKFVLGNTTTITAYADYGKDNGSIILTGPGTEWIHGTGVIRLEKKSGRLVVTDGATIRNIARLFIGFGANTSSNRLQITNGGKVLASASGANYLGYDGGSAGNSVYIGGINAVTGEKAIWNLGGGSLSVGYNALGANYNSMTVDAGGVLTNGSLSIGANSGAIGNSLVITNGGRVYGVSSVTYLGGSGYSSTGWVGGANPTTGEKSIWNPGNSFIVGGSGSSNTLIVAQNGMVTNILGSGFKLGNVAGSSYNTVVITNGGQVLSLVPGMIVGYESGASWNRVIVHNGRLMTVGGTGSEIGRNSTGNSVAVKANGIWDAGLRGIYVGASYTSANPGTSNFVVVTTGGVVTNACGGDRLGIGNAIGSNFNSLIVTNGGRFYMNGGNVIVGAYRNSSGTLSAGGNSNTMLIEGGLLDGSVNSYIGNASTGNKAELRGAAQWDLNAMTLTVGLNGGTANELKLGSGGTLMAVSTLTIGDGVTSTGNQLTLAGGNVSATTFVLGAGNRIAPVVGPSGITAAAVSGTATLADASTVKPIADAMSGYGKFAVLTATGLLVDNGIELDPSADPSKWSVSVVGKTLYLTHRDTRTLLQIR